MFRLTLSKSNDGRMIRNIASVAASIETTNSTWPFFSNMWSARFCVSSMALVANDTVVEGEVMAITWSKYFENMGSPPQCNSRYRAVAISGRALSSVCASIEESADAGRVLISQITQGCWMLHRVVSA